MPGQAPPDTHSLFGPQVSLFLQQLVPQAFGRFGGQPGGGGGDEPMQLPFMQVCPSGQPHELPHMGRLQTQVPESPQVIRSGQLPQHWDSRSTQRVELGHFTWGAQHCESLTQRPSHSRVPDGQTQAPELLQTRPSVQSVFAQQLPVATQRPPPQSFVPLGQAQRPPVHTSVPGQAVPQPLQLPCRSGDSRSGRRT